MKKVWAIYSDKRYMGLLRALSFRIALSRLAMLAETISQNFWPVFTLVLAAYTFIAFDGLAALGPVYAKLFLWGMGAVAAILIILGFRKVTIPTRQQAIDRLDAGIGGNPLASLRDYPTAEKGDPLTGALWDAHQARMANVAAGAKVTPPILQLAKRDRFGLRLMALIGVFVAVAFTNGVNRDELVRTLYLDSVDTSGGPTVEAWANPPDYTGVPTIYLTGLEGGGAIPLPIGTEIVLRIYGTSDRLALTEDVTNSTVELDTDQSATISAGFKVLRTGQVVIEDGRNTLADWRFIATKDSAPTISMPSPPLRGAGGVAEMAFDAADDYGVESGLAVITLNLAAVDRRYGLAPDPVPQDPIEVVLPMPVRGNSQEVSAILIEDFSESIWANLPVTITMTVQDGRGQIATTTLDATLPGKRFFLPLAAILIEQRRDLLWSPDNDRRVLQVLRAATHLPTDLNLSPAHFLQIRTVIRHLENSIETGLTLEIRTEIAQIFWDIAVLLEDGDLDDARERLRRAQEKLLQAIEEDADHEEISELMEELKDASENYMEMMAKEAQSEEQQRTENAPPPSDAADKLQEMLEQLQQLAENGEEELARQLLEEIQQMMEETQFADQQGEGGQEMQDLQDTLSQQQRLSDDTYRELQEMLEQGQNSTEQGQELADRQEALRELLEQLAQEGQPRAPNEQADQAMEEARDRLQDGDLGNALNEQAEAIENLRESIRQLGEENQQSGQGRDGLQAGETQNGDSENDPLGRPLGMTGSTFGGETAVPEFNASERALDLQDEIRRRTGEGERPSAEIEYLKRLLDRF